MKLGPYLDSYHCLTYKNFAWWETDLKLKISEGNCVSLDKYDMLVNRKFYKYFYLSEILVHLEK